MPDRIPAFIRQWLDENLYNFDGPAQYAGDEPGISGKTWAHRRVRWLVAASWDYSQASGNMAIPAVYRSINDAGDDYFADRFYLPATPRDLRLLERGGIPVFGVESKHQLRDFDVVGTSVSYTVLFMNFCKMLSMSDVPLRRRDRQLRGEENYPMVLVGGQAYCAPEFMAPVVDAVWLGEVEDEAGNGGISQVLRSIAQMKGDGSWKRDRAGCYEKLACEFNYLYFPQTIQTTYRYEDRGLPQPSKQVSGYRSTLPGLKLPFRARKVKDLDKVALLTEWPLLYSDPGMGAGDIEVARGCPAWCSFCRLSWVTKPYRQESVSRSVERAGQIRRNQGSLELSPFGPDFPMHTQKKELLTRLLQEVSGEVSTSSMRIDDFNADPDYSMLMAVGGTDSITLGLEGNSQRMRDLVGKGTADADVEEAVTRAIRAGIRKIKLYMISNLPGEEPGDVMSIVRLGQRLAEIRNSFGEAAKGVRIQFSWTPLLLEAQTPLQWFEVTAPDYTLQAALDMLRDLHIDLKIGTKAAPEKLAFFQACQRASVEVGEALVDVIDELDTASWGGFAKDMRERINQSLIRHGFLNGLDDIFGERFKGDLFGWEHIDTGVSRSLMWDTYAQMVEYLEGTDSQTYDAQYDEHYHGNEWVPRCDVTCQGAACGACDHEDLRLRTGYIKAAAEERDLDLHPVRALDHATIARRVRLKVIRPEQFRFVSNESLKYQIRRAAYRAGERSGVTIAMRSVRLASDSLAYRNRSAGVDYAEFGVTRPPLDLFSTCDFIRAFAAELSPWLVLGLEEGTDWDVLPASAKMPARAPSLWELEVTDEPEAVTAALRRWDAASEVPVLIRADSFYAGQTNEPGDAKEHVRDLWLVRDQHRYLLRMVLAGKLGPYQVYAALLGKPSWLAAAARTALRTDFFTDADARQGSLLQGTCEGCGATVPAGLLGTQFDWEYCPRCKDEAAGTAVAGLVRAGV